MALLNLPVLFTNVFGFRLIGLTGGISTGKSTATRMIKSLGIPVIDFDLIAREVVAPGSSCLKSIAAEFGKDVLNADGSLNRQKLGDIIFNDRTKKQALDRLMLRPIMYRFFWLCLQFFFLGKIPKSSPLTTTTTTIPPYHADDDSNTNKSTPPTPPQATHGIFTTELFPGLEQSFGGSRIIVLDCPLLFESGIHNLCSSTVFIDCSEEVQLSRLMARDNISQSQAEAKIKAQWNKDVKVKMASHVVLNDAGQKQLYEQLTTWFWSLAKQRFGIVLTKPQCYQHVKVALDINKRIEDLKQVEGVHEEGGKKNDNQHSSESDTGSSDSPIRDSIEADKETKEAHINAQIQKQQEQIDKIIKKTLSPRTRRIPIQHLVDTTTQPSWLEMYNPRNLCVIPSLLSCLFTAVLAIPSYFAISYIDANWFHAADKANTAAAASLSASTADHNIKKTPGTLLNGAKLKR